ncbi:MAG: hypothetical protein KAJ30_04300 [Candidatus Heimdallarchaeota archaeon]|nr:hypothetical protein [Candidatus Heimdallarchaeota archaeon]
MTETNEMTVAEAMEELKLINQRFLKNIELLKKYSSKAKKNDDLIQNQQEYMKSLIQSSKDLVERYMKIKLEIQKSNLNSVIDFKGRKYSIAEGLLLKQGLFDWHERLWGSISENQAVIQTNKLLEAMGRLTLTEEALEKLDLIPHLFYDEKEKQEKLDELLELRSYIDRLIEKSNHQTKLLF